MQFWLMLLNGFCTLSELTSLPYLCRVRGRLRLARDQIGLSADGCWWLGTKPQGEPVLLLRHVSIWTSHFAVIHLERPCGRRFTRWFCRRAVTRNHWRRMRVRFRYP